MIDLHRPVEHFGALATHPHARWGRVRLQRDLEELAILKNWWVQTVRLFENGEVVSLHFTNVYSQAKPTPPDSFPWHDVSGDLPRSAPWGFLHVELYCALRAAARWWRLSRSRLGAAVTRPSVPGRASAYSAVSLS